MCQVETGGHDYSTNEDTCMLQFINGTIIIKNGNLETTLCFENVDVSRE